MSKIDIQQMQSRVKTAEDVMKFRDTIVSALGPLWEMVEPFKVHDGTIERGIPAVHDELDCGVTPDEV